MSYGSRTRIVGVITTDDKQVLCLPCWRPDTQPAQMGFDKAVSPLNEKCDQCGTRFSSDHTVVLDYLRDATSRDQAVHDRAVLVSAGGMI